MKYSIGQKVNVQILVDGGTRAETYKGVVENKNQNNFTGNNYYYVKIWPAVRSEWYPEEVISE